MKITDSILYIGVNDHNIDLFEGQYIVPNGMSYNSYAIMDEKIAIMDTVDQNFTHEWLDNIAGALGAERLIMMTDIAGILRDKDDPSTLIPHISIDEAAKLYEDGVISGGMIPKVDCCIEAIHKGVKNVTIMDGRVPHSILMELLTNEGAGTMVMGE